MLNTPQRTQSFYGALAPGAAAAALTELWSYTVPQNPPYTATLELLFLSAINDSATVLAGAAQIAIFFRPFNGNEVILQNVTLATGDPDRAKSLTVPSSLTLFPGDRLRARAIVVGGTALTNVTMESAAKLTEYPQG